MKICLPGRHFVPIISSKLNLANLLNLKIVYAFEKNNLYANDDEAQFYYSSLWKTLPSTKIIQN